MEKFFYFFTELKPEKVSINIPNSFFKEGLCEEKDTELTFKVTGILISEKNVFIIFPKGILSSNNKKQNLNIAQILFQVLLKYNKESIKKFHVNFGEDITSANFLSLVNWIVEDYKINGLIQKEFKKREINGSGKINWSRTIKETTPYIINNDIFYLNTINVKSMRNLNSEITMVHYQILREIAKEFGWLLNFRINTQVNFDTITYSYDRMRYVIYNALRITYNQKEIHLYKMLLNYIDLKVSTKGKRKFYLLYTKYFQYVWEAICKHLFDNQQYFQHLLPKPYWLVENKELETEQIPDILTTDESNNLYIIDAKYYRSYLGIKYLPGWKDMVKQFFYAKTIDKNKFNKIYNIFIFPSPYDNEKQPILNHGKALIKGREDEFGEIKSYYLNPLVAMYLYFKNDTGNIKEELIKIINGNSL